jgi:hypothetical protein
LGGGLQLQIFNHPTVAIAQQAWSYISRLVALEYFGGGCDNDYADPAFLKASL